MEYSGDLTILLVLVGLGSMNLSYRMLFGGGTVIFLVEDGSSVSTSDVSI